MNRLAQICSMCSLAFLVSCGNSATLDSQVEPRFEPKAPAEIPLWVDVRCDAQGMPEYGEFAVVKMPSERIQWAMAVLDTGDCRIYGALVDASITEPDLCDIRFRSKRAVAPGRCACVPGRYDLEEGRPTSDECCRKHPNSVHCKSAPEAGKTPALQPATRTPQQP